MDGTIALLELTKIRLLLITIVILLTLLLIGLIILLLMKLSQHYNDELNRILNEKGETS